MLTPQRYSVPTSLSSSLPFVNTFVSPFQHLSPESKQRANHEDNIQFNIAPPTRCLGIHPKTTPSILTGGELKPPYIYITKTTICYMVIDPPLL